MENFIEPINGTKIAEYKTSRFGPTAMIGNVNETIIFLFFAYILIQNPFPFNTIIIWISRLLGFSIILFLVYSFYLKLKIRNLKFQGNILRIENNLRTTKMLEGKLFTLFVVKNGVEINNEFIPYKKLLSEEGIETFKLEDDFLIVKTSGIPFVSIYDCLDENEIKFKIDSKYLDCKEELLGYLNNLIDPIDSVIKENKNNDL